MSVLGRTNLSFPPVWLSLAAPAERTENWLNDLVTSAVEAKTVLDISSGPGLWGGAMRGTEATLLTLSDPQIENATDERHASDLTQAHMIETLCSIGREHIDFYCLRVRRAFEEFQLSGFLGAVEAARQEGHVRFVGIACEGPALATLATWQFHDAFEILLLPRSQADDSAFSMLGGLANERRVGVVARIPDGETLQTTGPILRKVRSAQDVSAAIGALAGH